MVSPSFEKRAERGVEAGADLGREAQVGLSHRSAAG
jgi:hypothetical protein